MQTLTDHPDAEAVYALLRGDLPALSLDAVYRTLDMFSSKGLAKILSVPTRRFHIEAGLHENDHFLCTQCEEIVDIDCSELPHSPPPAAAKMLGEVYGQERVYLGICLSCIAMRGESDDGGELRKGA